MLPLFLILLLFIVPFRTDRPRIRPAYLTAALIVVNTLLHLFGSLMEPIEHRVVTGNEVHVYEEPPLVRQFGLIGSEPTLTDFFSYQFIHGDWEHLIGNMLFLWIFGSLIEDVLRPWGLGALYVGGGLIAGLTHIGMSLAAGHDVEIPMIGASGSVAAIMGLFMLRFYKTRIQLFSPLALLIQKQLWVPAVWALLYWIGSEVLWGVRDALSPESGGVAHWAHIGGFLAGAIAAPFLGSISQAQKEYFSDDPETNVEYVRRNEAVSAAEKAHRGDPTNAYQLRRLAQAYAHAGEYEQATKAYQGCVHRFATRSMLDQATDVYLEMVAYNDAALLPPEVLLTLAKHMEPTHLMHAVAIYRYLVGYCPTHMEAEYALLRLAAIYAYSLNQPQEGMRCLNEFLHRYPNSRWIAEVHAARQQLGAMYGWV